MSTETTTNPYRIEVDGLGIHVIRGEGADEQYWASCESREEAARICREEWARERQDASEETP